MERGVEPDVSAEASRVQDQIEVQGRRIPCPRSKPDKDRGKTDGVFDASVLQVKQSSDEGNDT
jgi:hypothetical protein